MPTKTKVTKEMLVAALKDIAETCKGDPEIAHGLADAALLSYIGSDDVTAAYQSVERRYA